MGQGERGIGFKWIELNVCYCKKRIFKKISLLEVKVAHRLHLPEINNTNCWSFENNNVEQHQENGNFFNLLSSNWGFAGAGLLTAVRVRQPWTV